MKKYKVLIAHNYYQIAGGEDTVVQNEKDVLEKNGFGVVTYFRKNEEIKGINKLGKIKLFFETIFSIKTYREVKSILIKENIDILHVHNTLPLLSPSIYYAAFSCKIPVIQTVHNFRLLCPCGIFYRNDDICEECVSKGLMTSLKYRCYHKSYLETFTICCMLKFHRIIRTYNKINAYISLTEFNKDKLKLIIKDNSKIYVKPNFMYCIDDLNIDKDIQNYFVYLGRLDNSKGIKLLLNSWKKIKSKLYIIGQGEEKKYIERFIRENPTVDIEYLGFMEKKEAFKYLINAMALIVPSKWYEGFPMTIVESFSMGVPVIASRIGNLQSIIDNDKNGLLFENNNGEDLVRKVNSLINNYELARKLRYGAYDTFKLLYTDKSNFEQLINIYKEVSRKIND